MATSDKWAEKFARMEALLSRGNIFSTPVSTVKPVDSQLLISETPFLPPATRPTGPVKVPVAVEASVKSKTVDHKDKTAEPKVKKDNKKSHRSRKSDFYCVNTSYPMDNSLSGRRRPARQTSEKDVLCLHRLGRSSAVHSPDGVSYFLPV